MLLQRNGRETRIKPCELVNKLTQVVTTDARIQTLFTGLTGEGLDDPPAQVRQL